MRIDLHRHLGGSISPELVRELLWEQGEHVSIHDVRFAMQFLKNEEPGFHKFLRKFDILNTIKWTPGSIAKSVEQVVSDIKAEQVDLAEIRFTVDKYVDSIDRWDHGIAVEFLGSEFQKQAKEKDIRINLILCLKYEADREKQRRVAAVIEEYGVEEYVHGIDLVGDEAFFDVEFYKPIFREWKRNGKGLAAHVGESQTAENVKLAIEELQVDRVAHGIKIADSPDIMKLAADSGVCFEIAITSNLLTGVVDSVEGHPVGRMLEAGCKIAIGTDDPVICNTTLDREYELLKSAFQLSREQLFQIQKNSFTSSF
jgi:adenosine deaminase